MAHDRTNVETFSAAQTNMFDPDNTLNSGNSGFVCVVKSANSKCSDCPA